MKALILCEGKCSTDLTMFLLEQKEREKVSQIIVDRGELGKELRLRITEKLKLTWHSFSRLEPIKERTAIKFQCSICGNERTYGMVRKLDSDIRKLYGLATL